MPDPIVTTPQTTRRAPYADNPAVGQRGQRTQQRILDAALAVFGAEGYHNASVGRITSRAGCSRASFYQYFSDKADVFTHLASQVVRQFGAAMEALDPITPDEAGWAVVRGWVARYADIFDRYGAVFHAFSTAAESTEAIAGLRPQAGAANVATLHAKISGSDLSDRQLDKALGLLLEATTHVFYDAEMLRRADAATYPPERVEHALTDIIHRTIFGRLASVNVHGSERPPAAEIPFERSHDLTAEGESPTSLSPGARATVDTLLRTGAEVLLARGYHDTRVDDLVAAAGLSHGAFYRYFGNKAHFARTLVLLAIEPLSKALAAVPADPTRAELRAWLKRYNEIQVEEAAIIRVWVDATLHDPELRVDAAAALDWGRRRLAAFLRGRDFGDHDADAVVLLALLDAFGQRRHHGPTIDTTATVIERGLLGRDPRKVNPR